MIHSLPFPCFFCVIWVICLYMPIICYWTLTSFRGIRLVTVAWAWYFTRNGDETNQNPWYPAISWMSGAEKRFGLGRVVWLFRLPSDCRLADLGRSWQLPRMEIPMKQAPNYRYYRLLIWWNLHAVGFWWRSRMTVPMIRALPSCRRQWIASLRCSAWDVGDDQDVCGEHLAISMCSPRVGFWLQPRDLSSNLDILPMARFNQCMVLQRRESPFQQSFNLKHTEDRNQVDECLSDWKCGSHPRIDHSSLAMCYITPNDYLSFGVPHYPSL